MVIPKETQYQAEKHKSYAVKAGSNEESMLRLSYFMTLLITSVDFKNGFHGLHVYFALLPSKLR